ncbi:unnamed protein product [Blepharisma stoltei]|uniref:Uncharacterized protein n=1 Tax=Blepharisma stoltei TaxID=1481888 RepID=A0AAU9J0N9_9CILI|nr:unnamed protein product [Blepharisma stoltei]
MEIRRVNGLSDAQNTEQAFPSFVGFSTIGSKQPVKISEESWKKAQSLFGDEEESQGNFLGSNFQFQKFSDQNIEKNTQFEAPVMQAVGFGNMNQQMPMFTSGSFKNISISDEALKKAQAMFSFEDESQKKQMPMFTSGSSKNISISDEALKKAQAMFSFEDESQYNGNFGGFSKPKSQNSQNTIRNCIENQQDESWDIRSIGSNSTRTSEAGNKFKPVSLAFKSDRSQTIRTKLSTNLRPGRKEFSANGLIRPKTSSLKSPFRPPTTSLKIKQPSPVHQSKRPLLKTPETVEKSFRPSTLSLKEINNFKPLSKFYDSSGIAITAESSFGYLFHCNCFNTMICSCNKSSNTSWEDFYDKLVDDGFKCSKEWVNHHYRFLVWKYASYERRLPKYKGAFCVKKIYEGLKRRFEVEISGGRRSIIKKIIDGDEFANKRMILCVGTVKRDENVISLELTDGWYSLFSVVTKSDPIFNLVDSKKIFQGQKVEIYGAEKKESCIKISYNSLRRAPWYAKLGLCNSQYPFPVNVLSINESGGLISRVIGYIQKIYPFISQEFREETPASEGKSAKLRAFFDIKIKDALIDHNKTKGKGSAIITIYNSAPSLYEDLLPGQKVSFINLQVSKLKSHGKLHLNFIKGSSVITTKEYRKDLIKKPRLLSVGEKINKEGDIVGILLKTVKTRSDEIYSLIMANSNMHLMVLNIHHPGQFGKPLTKLVPSYEGNMKIIAMKNVYAEGYNSFTTSINSEMVKGSYTNHIAEEAEKLSALWKTKERETLWLVHKKECDKFGCVCHWNYS